MVDNTILNQHLESVADKARIADDFAARGDYQQAVYRLTDALLDVKAVLGELSLRSVDSRGAGK